MADTSFLSSDSEQGVWQTVEQAAVSLGLSVRTVNRHISAQKLKSRLIEGRREVFVPAPDLPNANGDTVDRQPSQAVATEDQAGQSGEGGVGSDSTKTDKAGSFSQASQTRIVESSFDYDTALARADNAADKAELAVSAYQSLARSIEGQARSARKMAATAWCIVGILMVGVTVAVGWTASRVTRAESEAQHLKDDAESANKRADQEADLANKRAQQEADLTAKNQANHEHLVADLREQLSVAVQRASRAEGQAAILEEMRPVTRPTTRPDLINIDGLRSALLGGSQ